MILKALAVFAVNFILYALFGSFFGIRKNDKWSFAVTLGVGFFAYYAIFFLFAIPFMLTYRQLSQLAAVWEAVCALTAVISLIMYGRKWRDKISDMLSGIRDHKMFAVTVIVIASACTLIAVITYSFTLDAAYYVAGVATNVDTNMINVYDPFTGSWLDHFELRYAFATYYVNDAVVCRITGIPALVQTKGIMSATVMFLVNILYVHICRYFCDDDRQAVLMYVFMTVVNFMFISIYTASNFLMTRTYEGKSIVGNISIVLIFVIFMELVKYSGRKGTFLMLFMTCLGTATVSSTANMVIPAEVFVLFVPYALQNRKPKMLIKVLGCIMPELIMMLIYVLYVKGYFAIYTFQR